MPTKPLLTTEQHCGYCGKTTEHNVVLENGFEVVARRAICGKRPAISFPTHQSPR